MRRVVITGMGAVTPMGTGIRQFWKNSLSGISGISKITRFDPANLPVRIAGEVSDWNPDSTFTSREINRYDRLTLFALKAADEAWSNADLRDHDPFKCGVVWASGNGGMESIEDGVAQIIGDSQNPRLSPYYVPRTLIDTPTGEIAIRYNLKGYNHAVVAACASSNAAIINAVNAIRWNQADVIITGASEAPITPSLLVGFNALKALSRNNDNPKLASCPLSEDRDGFVMGEGGAALVLEELEHARARNAHILAEVAGGAITNDAYHSTAAHPHGEGAKRGMEAALEDAGIKGNEIDHINLHATSTPIGDRSEIEAVKSLFGDQRLWLSACKGGTGHLLGASGAVEAVHCILCLQENMISPAITSGVLDQTIPSSYELVRENPQKWSSNYILSNNFGFGGHNAVVVFKKLF